MGHWPNVDLIWTPGTSIAIHVNPNTRWCRRKARRVSSPSPGTTREAAKAAEPPLNPPTPGTNRGAHTGCRAGGRGELPCRARVLRLRAKQGGRFAPCRLGRATEGAIPRKGHNSPRTRSEMHRHKSAAPMAHSGEPGTPRPGASPRHTRVLYSQRPRCGGGDARARAQTPVLLQAQQGNPEVPDVHIQPGLQGHSTDPLCRPRGEALHLPSL